MSTAPFHTVERERLESIANRAERLSGSAPETVMFDLVTGRLSITATALEALLAKVEQPALALDEDIDEVWHQPKYLVVVDVDSALEWATTVLMRGTNGKYHEVEEIGCSNSLRGNLIDASRVIRTGTAVIERKA